jgi:gluconolactonase
VMHGRVRAADGSKALDRFNRSYEYDGLGDKYARFLSEELLPEVEKQKTSDGRAIRLSKDPNDRAIGGSSSGAVCAFTAAWERPDLFRRVFSTIGTYVGLRGADRYPTLIRKYEPKPLRVYLQDGSNDLNIYAGDWWMANQMMERALVFAGYEVTHIWGEGGHNGQQGTQVFPEAMRWLWKDWPAPVKAGKSRNAYLNALIREGEGWKGEGEQLGAIDGLATDSAGRPYYTEGATDSPAPANGSKFGANHLSGKLAFGPGGLLYETGGGRLTSLDVGPKPKVVAKNIRASDLVVASNGNVYLADAGSAGQADSIWLIKPNGQKTKLDSGYQALSGITLSPDQTLLYATDESTHWVYSYQIQADGSLAHKQEYFWVHVPDTEDASGARGMCTDQQGRLYVATAMGVQVFDQPGRANAILPTPARPTALAFGGPNGDVLYAACGNRLYARKLNTKGAQPWAAPIKPPVPGL